MALESDINGIVSSLNVAPRWDRLFTMLDVSYDSVPEHVRELRSSTRAKLLDCVNDSRRVFASMTVPSVASRLSKRVAHIFKRGCVSDVSPYAELSQDDLAAAMDVLLQDGVIEEHAPVTFQDIWRRDNRGIPIPEREKVVFLLEEFADSLSVNS